MKADAQRSRHNYATPLPCERNLTVQYLVMKNRIINLAYRDVEINQPMPHSTDNATVSVQATQSEKYPRRFFRDRLKNVNSLSSHLAECLTTRC